MKVILTENVEKLGEVGEVKEVANGYARNFLFPRDLAIPATKGALQEAANRRLGVEKRAAAQVSAAQANANRLNGLSVLLYARTGEQNRLYGAITPTDVAEALRVQHGQTVDRRRIKLDSSIHRTGKYTATVAIGHNLTAQLNLLVEPESSKTGALTSVAASAPVVEAPAPEAAAPDTADAAAPDTAEAAAPETVEATAPETVEATAPETAAGAPNAAATTDLPVGTAEGVVASGAPETMTFVPAGIDTGAADDDSARTATE
ncbi:MAG TPA: 50S ribosomal protein L9 [Chloroflexia bacterium]|nr:50S ribosomal protein L9 [Chloroflexia bacterium]